MASPYGSMPAAGGGKRRAQHARGAGLGCSWACLGLGLQVVRASRWLGPGSHPVCGAHRKRSTGAEGRQLPAPHTAGCLCARVADILRGHPPPSRRAVGAVVGGGPAQFWFVSPRIFEQWRALAGRRQLWRPPRSWPCSSSRRLPSMNPTRGPSLYTGARSTQR